ncbi:MAG: DNA repair protein RecN [Bacteroidota bacterium]
MLKHLSIQNYVLIDKIEIDLPDGLTIITGETGTGKSILLGALALLVGERTDTSVLLNKTHKCIVEGIFDISNYSLKKFFHSNALDYENNTVIRREISSEGKSRAFINDTPVALNLLKELGAQLVDIHSQHEILLLNDTDFHLSVIDSFTQHTAVVNEYRIGFNKYKETERMLNELLEKEKQSKRDIDYWQFQFDELEHANLQLGEQEKIETDMKVLNNFEKIKLSLEKAAILLSESEINILSSLGEAKQLLLSIAEFNSSYNELLSRLNSSYIELSDITNEIENTAEHIFYDPSHAEELTNRINTIFSLQKKHQVNSVEELLAIKIKIENRLKDILSLEKEINVLQLEKEKLYQKLFLFAKKISTDRKKSFVKLEKDISVLLSALAMPNAQFHIEHLLLDTMTESGIDKIKFLFSANKGSAMKEISKIASGGELSRLMLSIKYLVAKNTALPSIIFDEIDSGVSGEIAGKVGKMILGMSENMQVIAITHLPQIASKGNSHFTIFKEEYGNKTITNIKLLNREERVKEIASMLSEGKLTGASMKNAKELMGIV